MTASSPEFFNFPTYTKEGIVRNIYATFCIGSQTDFLTQEFCQLLLLHISWEIISSKLVKEIASHSSILACRIPGMGEPGGLPPMGLHRVRHDWSDFAAAAEINLILNILVSLSFSYYSSNNESNLYWKTNKQKTEDQEKGMPNGQSISPLGVIVSAWETSQKSRFQFSLLGNNLIPKYENNFMSLYLPPFLKLYVLIWLIRIQANTIFQCSGKAQILKRECV